MLTYARPLKHLPAILPNLIFALGILVLLASGVVLYFWISLGTEALLAPWPCDCSGYRPPAVGTMQRTLNDFFAGPGRDVPSLIFVLVTGAIVAIRTRHAKNRTWLPLLFAMANVVLLAAHIVAISLAWSLSDSIVGPRVGIDAGYHRTWYGIAATCIFWIAFWLVLLRLPIPTRQAPLADR